MADLSNAGLDPNVPESTGGFTLLPDGKYKVVIVGDKVVPTKANDGRILELDVQIVEGPHAGHKIPDRINIINKSAQAQAIGQGQLRRLCTLTNIPYPPANTASMYGKPLMATIVSQEFTSNKDNTKKLKSNKITNYNPVNPVQPQQPAAPTNSGSW